MTKKQLNSLICSIFCFTLIPTIAFSQTPEPSQEASGLESLRTIQEKERELRKQIESGISPDRLKEKTPTDSQPLPDDSEKVLISKITIEGAELLSTKEINKIIKPYEGQELSLREMQTIASKITDAYRTKGYITSRAILPPQEIEGNELKILVIEGKAGSLQIKGNKYFRTSLVRRIMGIKEGEAFDYDKARNNLSYFNQSPDRNGKLVLVPGEKPGTTDLILNVEDSLPIHIGFTYDNYASRYIGQDRYQVTLTHNNLLGFGDVMTYRFQRGREHDMFNLHSLRYQVPLTNKTSIGFFAMQNYLELGREFKNAEARGKSRIYSVYANHILYQDAMKTISFNTGFDYKDVYNFQLGVETSRDRLRIANAGFNVDWTHHNGRTIVINKTDVGIPDILGGLQDVDSRSTRAVAGGDFIKNTLDVLRLQQMPFGSTLLLKTQFVESTHSLVAAEQLQIGGIANVRGYPTSEIVGDSGQTYTAELSLPVYGLPKSWSIPMSKSTFYDATRIAVFYDYGRANIRNASSGEQDSDLLRSAGVGFRFNLPEDFYVRVDTAWALDRTPSDGNNARTWFQVSKEF